MRPQSSFFLIGMFVLHLVAVEMSLAKMSAPKPPISGKLPQTENPKPPIAQNFTPRRHERFGRSGLYRAAIKRVMPEYPRRAKKEHIRGDVRLEFTIDENGEVQHVRAVDGHPLLQEPAVKAMKQWKFLPAFVNPAPVETTRTLTFRFGQ